MNELLSISKEPGSGCAITLSDPNTSLGSSCHLISSCPYQLIMAVCQQEVVLQREPFLLLQCCYIALLLNYQFLNSLKKKQLFF